MWGRQMVVNVSVRTDRKDKGGKLNILLKRDVLCCHKMMMNKMNMPSFLQTCHIHWSKMILGCGVFPRTMCAWWVFLYID